MQHERDRMETVIARGTIVAVIAFVVIMHAGGILRGSATGNMGQVLWSIQLGDSNASLPAICDVDGDGSKEIVFSFSNSIVCLTGSGSSKWSKSMTSPSMPVLAQADQDKALEIFVYASNSLYCLKGNGSIKWQSTIPEAITNKLAVADVNKDNITEIFLSTINNRIYCLSANNGTIKWNSTAGLNLRSPLIAGTTADGNALLITGSTNGTLRGISSINGSVRWTTSFNNGTITPLAACDADGDGDIDVIVKTNTLACVCITNGTVKWQLSSLPGSIDNVLTGDVNRDGRMEIITSPQKNTFGKIYCLSASTGVLLWQTSSTYPGELMQVADINNDHSWEICLPLVMLAGINGSVTWTGSPSHTRDAWYTFALGDVNGDGMLEMVYSYYYYYQSGRSSYYYYYVECARFPGKSWAQSSSWSSSTGSVLHTNVYLDEDNDHVSTSMEIVIGTNPLKNDTDGDGISDGDEIAGFTNPSDIYDPGIYAPTLTSCMITPANGTQATLFNFTTIYSDRDNNTPVYVTLVLDGNWISMQKQKGTNVNYLNGVGYTYSKYLSPGNHSWWVETADSRFTSQTQQKSFIVGLTNFHAPILNLSRAERVKEFFPLPRAEFFIQYSDIDNNPPSNIMLTLDSVNYTMTKQDSTDINNIDGCTYSCKIPLSNGLHEYSFVCSDGVFMTRSGLFVMNFTCLPEFQLLDYRLWGGKSADYGYAVWGNGDAIYTCGYTQSFGNGNYDLVLVKWDAAGNQAWNRTWGGTSADYGYAVWGNGDAIYTCGYTLSYGNGNGDLLLVKWDAAGNQAWNRTWGGSKYDYGYAVWGNGDAIYTCGYTLSFGNGNGDLVLVKWDAAGNQAWNRTWGGTNAEYGYAIWGNDDAIYTCGITSSYGKGNYDLVLVKWDAAGNQAWNRTWGGTNADYGYAVWGNDDAIYTCGYTLSFGNGNGDLVLVKWDAAGNQAWNRTWGGSKYDYGYAVWGNDDAIYMCGYTLSFGKGNGDLVLVKWDAAGNQAWNRTWGGTNADYGYSVWGNGDAIYTCGITASYGKGNYDLVLIRWNGVGNLVWNITWGGSNDDYGCAVYGNYGAIYTCGYTGSYGKGSCDLLLIKYILTSPPLLELREPMNGSTIYQGKNRFSWGLNGNINGPVYYSVQISSDKAFSTVALEATNIISSQAIITVNLTINIPYGRYYWRVGISSGIYSGNWSEPFILRPIPFTVPDAPVGLIPTAGNAQIILTWTRPSSNGGSAITGYKIFCGTSSGSETLLATVGVVLTYTAAGLTNGQVYYFKVAAMNAMGVGANSTEMSAMPAAVPGAPAGLLATAGNAQAILAWTAPASNGGTAITGYKIYCSTASGNETLLATVDTMLTYTATGLTNGQSYFFQVSALNAMGEGARSTESSTTLRTVPYAPTGLTTTPGSTQVVLTWVTPGNNGGSVITGYKIFSGNSSGGEKLLATVDVVVIYTATGLTNGRIYYFKVAAMNAIGIGANSSEISAVPATVPGAPTGLTPTAGNAQVSLIWTAPSSNGGTAITGYKIFCGFSSGSETLLATVGVVLTYTAAGLTNGQVYYFKIAGINTAGVGVNSTEASATPVTTTTTPSSPQSLIITAGNAVVVLNWITPASSGGSAIIGYKVFRGTSAGCESLLANLGPVLTYTSTGLANGQIYYFKVAAMNAVGTGANSTEASAIPITVPGAPAGCAATAGNRQIQLAWTPPASNGGSAITGYKVFRGTSAGCESLLANLGPVLTYTSTGLANGQVYYFKVAAMNAVGTGANSTEASAIPITVPGAPAGCAATAGNQQIQLAWTPPASNGGSAITGYKVFRGISAGSESLLANLGPVLTYTSTGLANGQVYYFKVAAMNAVGTGTNSTEASAIPITVPGAPTGFTAVAGNRQIQLAWTPPASNGGSVILSFIVYRGSAPGNETFFTILGMVTGWTDTSVVNGQSYYYKVSAVNAAGEGVKSIEASATPAVTPGIPLNLHATGGSKQVVLAWQTPTNNGGLPITNYIIYRGTTSLGEMFLAKIGNVTTFTDTDVANDRNYYYTVSAINSFGVGTASNETCATPNGVTQVNGPPDEPAPQSPSRFLSQQMINLLSYLLIAIGAVMTVSTLVVARRLKIRHQPPVDMIDQETSAQSTTHSPRATVMPGAFSISDPASPVRSIISSIEKARRLMRFDIADYTEQPATDATLDFVPNIAAIFEDTEHYIDVDTTQAFTEIDENLVNTSEPSILPFDDALPPDMDSRDQVLCLKGTDLHGHSNVEMLDIDTGDNDATGMLTLICPDCTGSIEITDSSDTSPHACKNCQKPMQILLECKACFTTWWVPAEDAIQLNVSGCRCPVCHEKITP